jgi:hypothetical protein
MMLNQDAFKLGIIRTNNSDFRITNRPGETTIGTLLAEKFLTDSDSSKRLES